MKKTRKYYDKYFDDHCYHQWSEIGENPVYYDEYFDDYYIYDEYGDRHYENYERDDHDLIGYGTGIDDEN